MQQLIADITAFAAVDLKDESFQDRLAALRTRFKKVSDPDYRHRGHALTPNMCRSPPMPAGPRRTLPTAS